MATTVYTTKESQSLVECLIVARGLLEDDEEARQVLIEYDRGEYWISGVNEPKLYNPAAVVVRG